MSSIIDRVLDNYMNRSWVLIPTEINLIFFLNYVKGFFLTFIGMYTNYTL